MDRILIVYNLLNLDNNMYKMKALNGSLNYNRSK
jgi:hypothetical protein